MTTMEDDPLGSTQALLAAIIENSDDAIVSKTLDGIVTSWNPGAERLFGYCADEMIGRPIAVIAAPGREQEMPAILARIRAGEKVDHFETERRHKSGRVVPVSLTVSPVRGADGRIVGASKIARDIAERRLAEERQTLLVRELNHRVKNTLATVAAIANRTIAASTGLADFEVAFSGRLHALARAHELLSEGFWQAVALRDVVARAVAPFGDDGRVDNGGGPAKLKPKPALTLALVLHELTTNAAKYGALSVPDGRVAVTVSPLAMDGRPGRRLVWRESVAPPARRSFGSQWIEAGVRGDLRGTAVIDYARDGLVCTIDFRADDDILHDAPG